MHDFLWENSWTYRKSVEQGIEKGMQQGMQQGMRRGMQQGMRRDIALVVQARFPALTALAKTRVATLKNEEIMQQTLIAMSTAQTEEEARQYLLTLENTK